MYSDNKDNQDKSNPENPNPQNVEIMDVEGTVMTSQLPEKTLMQKEVSKQQLKDDCQKVLQFLQNLIQKRQQLLEKTQKEQPAFLSENQTPEVSQIIPKTLEGQSFPELKKAVEKLNPQEQQGSEKHFDVKNEEIDPYNFFQEPQAKKMLEEECEQLHSHLQLIRKLQQQLMEETEQKQVLPQCQERKSAPECQTMPKEEPSALAQIDQKGKQSDQKWPKMRRHHLPKFYHPQKSRKIEDKLNPQQQVMLEPHCSQEYLQDPSNEMEQLKQEVEKTEKLLDLPGKKIVATTINKLPEFELLATKRGVTAPASPTRTSNPGDQRELQQEHLELEQQQHQQEDKENVDELE